MCVCLCVYVCLHFYNFLCVPICHFACVCVYVCVSAYVIYERDSVCPSYLHSQLACGSYSEKVWASSSTNYCNLIEQLLHLSSALTKQIPVEFKQKNRNKKRPKLTRQKMNP
jgi:hypothetical protein